MMTLDGAIKHAEEVAEEQDKLCKRYDDASGYSRSHNESIRVADAKWCERCAKEHRQLAEWLKELKQLRQQASWIPTSERQPEENGNYLAFYRSGDGTADLEFMMVDHCNAGGGWLHEVIGKKLYKKVVAWMPLPEPYKAEARGGKCQKPKSIE